MTLKNAKRLLKGRQNVLNDFESKIFPTGKHTQGKGIKILTTKCLKPVKSYISVSSKIRQLFF